MEKRLQYIHLLTVKGKRNTCRRNILSKTPISKEKLKTGSHDHRYGIKPGTKCSRSMSGETKVTVETPDHHRRSSNEYPFDLPSTSGIKNFFSTNVLMQRQYTKSIILKL